MITGAIVFAQSAVNAMEDRVFSAIHSGDEVCIQSLLNAGANVDELLKKAMEDAASYGDSCSAKEAVKHLLDARYGANANLLCFIDRSLLLVAVEKGFTEIVKLLLDRGANVNFEVHYEGVLSAAAYSGNLEIMQLLLDPKYGAKVNSGITPLYSAADFGHANIVRLLLDHGADIGLIQEIDHSHLESEVRYILEWQALLNSGTDINHQDIPGISGNNGITMLHLAVISEYKEAAKFLLDRGADINLKDKQGCTPLQLARKRVSENNIRRLLENWQQDELPRIEQAKAVKATLALTMASHPRLGAHSPASTLPSGRAVFGTIFELLTLQPTLINPPLPDYGLE